MKRVLPLLLMVAAFACSRIRPRAPPDPPTRSCRCSTSRTTRRASSTPRSTPAFARHVEGEDRADGHDRAVARRLGQAGARRDRRPRGRRRHARRSPTTSTRSRKAGLIHADWQTRLPEQRRAVHLDDRVPGPQGQPQGDQGLGRSREAGRRGDHAEPEDLGRRALELPRGVGLRAQAAAATTPRRAQFVDRALQATCRCSTRARAARRRRSSSAASATCCSRGRTRRCSRSRSSARTRSRSSCRRSVDPRRAAGRGRRQGRRQARHARGREAYLQFLYTPEGQEIAAQALLPPARRGGRGAPARSRRSSCSRSTRCSAAGRRRRRRTSPTAASSTRSPRGSARPWRRRSRRSPASG